MTVQIDTTAEIDAVRLKQETSHPSAPSSGHELLYVVSGSAHGGLFVKDSAGRQIGPFITGSPSAASSTPIWEQIYEYMAANNTDPIDTKITSGNYILLIYFSSNNTASWKSATNAVHTVAGGKTLKVLHVIPAGSDAADVTATFRGVRLRNTTDGADVVAADPFLRGAIVPWSGDLATASQLPAVAAGKTVKLEIFNSDTNKRAGGGIAICYES